MPSLDAMPARIGCRRVARQGFDLGRLLLSDPVAEESSTFRAGVAILVINDQGLVLALERVDLPGAWQLPQGGLLDEESPADAARRELREETGIAWDQVKLLEEHPLWLGYELPAQAISEKTGRGQVHKWFLLRYHGTDDSVVLGGRSAEFVRWRWMHISELIHLVWEIRRPIYEQVARDWSAFLS